VLGVYPITATPLTTGDFLPGGYPPDVPTPPVERDYFTVSGRSVGDLFVHERVVYPYAAITRKTHTETVVRDP
jgi:hypothetical protein